MRGSSISQRRVPGRSKRPCRALPRRSADFFDLLRFAATCLIAVALAMRAAVPVGWMPDTAASQPAAMIPCPMMDAMGGMAMPQPKQEPQHPANRQLPASHEGSICPFATAAQPIRAVEPRQIELAPPRLASFAPLRSVLAIRWDHVPRAPPPQGNTTTI